MDTDAKVWFYRLQSFDLVHWDGKMV
jgi:hypothetical protein